MALNLNAKVADRLKESPGQRFKAREIAEWIFAKYPDECREKLESSAVLNTEAQLIAVELVRDVVAAPRIVITDNVLPDFSLPQAQGPTRISHVSEVLTAALPPTGHR